MTRIALAILGALVTVGGIGVWLLMSTISAVGMASIVARGCWDWGHRGPGLAWFAFSAETSTTSPDIGST